MKIKMRTTAAGPNVSFSEGKEYDVSGVYAQQLINGGYAVAVEPEEVEEAPETATAPEPETAMKTAPKRRGPRKKK
jgi:hypothetical protein